MEKKKIGKIRVLIAAVVFIIFAASVGVVLAACGVFSSDKQKAFELLSQATERLNDSAVGEYLGMEQLAESLKEKPSMVNVKLSDLDLDKRLAPEKIDLSEFTLEYSNRYDVKAQKVKMDMSLARGSSKLSLDLYGDKDKMVAAVPELINGKAFCFSTETLQSFSPNTNNANLPAEDVRQFEEDLTKFLKEEMEKLKEDVSCDELDNGKEGYQVTITKESMDMIISDFTAFMEGQTKITDSINRYMRAIIYTQQQRGITDSGADQFDFMSSLKDISQKLSQYTQDFTFEVYGENGNLTELKTSGNVRDVPITVSLTFQGEPGNSTAILQIANTAPEETEEVAVTVMKKSMTGETLEDSLSVDVSVRGSSVGTVSLTENFTKADNAYSCTADVSAPGGETAKLKLIGSVKDLKPGSYVDFILDDVSLTTVDSTRVGTKLFSLAADIKIGEMDGNMEPPEGEAVEVKSLADLTPYAVQFQTGISKIMYDWGIFSPLAPGPDHI